MTPFAMTLWRATYNILTVQARPTTDRFGFSFFRRVPAKQLQPDNVPMLSIYLLREVWSPDGDFNVGEPRFIYNIHLGFEGSIIADNEDDQYDRLGEGMHAVDTALLTNPNWVRLTEGVLSVDRVFRTYQTGETLFAECKEEMVVCTRDTWPPNVPDWLEKVGMQTVFPSVEKAGDVQQVFAEYDIPTGE